MLLERIDELTLRAHDLRGNPAALLGGVIERIDRLKDELVTAREYIEWAAALPTESDDAAAPQREREFAALYPAHDRMLAERGALDFGDLAARSPAGCCATTRACARGSRERYAPRARRRVPGHQPRAGAAARGCWLASTATWSRGRRRPGHPPLPRRRRPRTCATFRESAPGRDASSAWTARSAARERILDAAATPSSSRSRTARRRS